MSSKMRRYRARLAAGKVVLPVEADDVDLAARLVEAHLRHMARRPLPKHTAQKFVSRGRLAAFGG